MKDSPGITRTLAVCKDVEISWDDCYGAMRRASKRSRFWQFKEFFKRIQPVARMTTHSIAMPRYLRVLVFSCRLYGALWLTCVCYLASGDVDSESSPERCKSNKDNIFAVIAFGIVSFTCSHFFAWVVVLLHRRHYIYQEHWTPKMKKKKLYKWWAMDALATVVAIAFVLFCIFVLGVFLGKVSSGDNRAYFLSAVIGLVKDGAVSPAIRSILMMVSINVIHSSPTLMRKAREGLALKSRDEHIGAQSETPSGDAGKVRELQWQGTIQEPLQIGRRRDDDAIDNVLALRVDEFPAVPNEDFNRFPEPVRLANHRTNASHRMLRPSEHFEFLTAERTHSTPESSLVRGVIISDQTVNPHGGTWRPICIPQDVLTSSQQPARCNYPTICCGEPTVDEVSADIFETAESERRRIVLV